MSKWDDLKSNLHFYGSLSLCGIFLAGLLLFTFTDLSSSIKERASEKKRMSECYKVLEDAPWFELDELYKYVEQNHICGDDCEFLKFETYYETIYDYCEAAAYIADNR